MTMRFVCDECGQEQCDGHEVARIPAPDWKARALAAMADAERFKAEHLRACETIAAMHKAAVGAAVGPRRGVVEDVEDLRTALRTACRIAASCADIVIEDVDDDEETRDMRGQIDVIRDQFRLT